MNIKNEIDSKISNALYQETESIIPEEALKNKIDMQIKKAEREHKRSPKLFGRKKMVVLAATLCLIIATTAFTYMTGGVTALIGTAGPAYETSNFEEMEKAEEKLGFPIDAIENFDNGYQFYKMYVEGVKGIDANNHTVGTYKELSITYKRGEESLNFSACRPFAEELGKGEGVKTTREKKGVAFYLREDTYKSVPVGYELTETDKNNEKRKDYFISVGSDKVEEEKVFSVSWEKSGIKYYLGAYHWKDGGETLLDMAEEISFPQNE